MGARQARALIFVSFLGLSLFTLKRGFETHNIFDIYRHFIFYLIKKYRAITRLGTLIGSITAIDATPPRFSVIS